MVVDIEKNSDIAYVHGYPSLANFIASNPGHSTAIYRRFDHLSARTLLLLQSELIELEAQLRTIDEEDLLNNQLDDNVIARDFARFKTLADSGKPREAKRMKLLMKIKKKLKEYREAMLLEHTMLSLPQPSNQAYKAIYNTFWNRDRQKPSPTLEGNSRHILDNKDDLMAVGPRIGPEDRLTHLLRTQFAVFFRSKPYTDTKIIHISDKKIAAVVATVNILLAAAFLFGAIYNLYYVQDPQKTLGLITGYTVAFALAVGLLTNAKPSEVFGACAAYAAVLVVFVSGNLGNVNTSGTCSDSSGTANGVG